MYTNLHTNLTNIKVNNEVICYAIVTCWLHQIRVKGMRYFHIEMSIFIQTFNCDECNP